MKKVDPTMPRPKNRTGISASPIDSKDIIQEAARSDMAPPADRDQNEVRAEYEAEGVPLGTMPMPAGLKGIAKSALQALKGQNAGALLDKVGERLAFERTGTRLYEALIGKLEARGAWGGGPTRDELVHIMEQELEHFHVLRDAMTELGGDPTAMTPAANVSAVASMGIPEVVTDARSTLAQALHAVHIAELTDNDGWAMLVAMSSAFGLDDVAQRFQRCADQEREHLAMVRRWMTAYATASAQGEGADKGGAGVEATT